MVALYWCIVGKSINDLGRFKNITNLFWAEFMRAILEMAANERKNDYVSVLCRELQAHVEVVFEKFVIKTEI